MTITSISDLPLREIRRLCESYDVEELLVFGSILEGRLSQSSDVDFLVTFRNDDPGPWMARLQGLQKDLSELIERPADVVPKKNLKWLIKDQILKEARPLYAKG